MESQLVIRKQDIARLPQVDFQEGAAILVDKPLEWTSFNVVSKFRYIIRHHLGLKKFKIGHAGTLDPLASGLLILCAGRYTKRSTEFMGLEKEYVGTITLGATRPSYDLETEVDQEYPTDHISKELIEGLIPRFTGELMQVPPIYSAKQIKGRRAYTSARAGKEIQMTPCPVVIGLLEFTRIQLPEVDFKVRCSKGTYIRSLAHDIGKALDSGAYLSALTRTAIGYHRLEEALQIGEFEAALKERRSI